MFCNKSSVKNFGKTFKQKFCEAQELEVAPEQDQKLKHDDQEQTVTDQRSQVPDIEVHQVDGEETSSKPDTPKSSVRSKALFKISKTSPAFAKNKRAAKTARKSTKSA